MTATINATHSKNPEFPSGRSHDLQSPLTVIRGYAHLLLETTNDLPDGEQREALQRVHQESAQALKMLQRLLGSR